MKKLLIKEIESVSNYYLLIHSLYQLLKDISYLETTYNQIQKLSDNLESDVAAKFLSHPILAIVEEWEKVND